MSYVYLTPSGVVVADTSDTQQVVTNEYKQAFGADLVTTPDTPQGVLITAETVARNSVINNNAALANQINPHIAGGSFLDAVLALTGIQRNAQTPTVVTNVTLTGVATTNIPVGSQARTAAGDIFQITSAALIPGSGTFYPATFQSISSGPISCATNALDEIVSGVLGWETVTNGTTSVTTLGTSTQSDQAARAFRNNTLAFQGLSLGEAITSALYATEGVTSLTFQENYSASPMTINGIYMTGHSVYACVKGGTDVDVAAALLENKSSGAAWNGSTDISVIEPASGQTYAVQFDRPTPVGILVRVTTPNGDTDTIIQSVLDYAAGLVSITDQNDVEQTLPGFIVGASVSPFDIAGAVVAENPGIYIKNLEIGLAPSGSLSNDVIPIGVNQIASVTIDNISVVIA